MANVARKIATRDDFYAIADSERFHELIDGEIVRKANPSFEHGSTQSTLAAMIAPFRKRASRDKPGGWWFATEVEIEFGSDIYRPDIAGWRRDRLPERPTGTPVPVRPDWVCEILSSSNSNYDLGTKYNAYHRSGVPHYWIADPATARLRVHRFMNEGYLVVLNADREQVVRAEPFEAIEFRVGTLFGDEET